MMEVDDELSDTILRAIDMLVPIGEGKAQTSADGLFSKTRERAATINDARRVLSFAIPMLRRVHASLANTAVAGDEQRDGNAAMAAEYQRWIDYYHQGRDYDDFLKECVYSAPQASEGQRSCPSGDRTERHPHAGQAGLEHSVKETDRLKGVLMNVRKHIGQHELHTAIKVIDAALAVKTTV